MSRLRAAVSLALSLCSSLCSAQVAAWVVAKDAVSRPRLVVLLIVDQFRADYLERFRAEFVPGGFRRLLERGAVFANTQYDYAVTETAPGHATLAAGTTPAYHGIVGNEWWDRGKNRRVSSIEDANYKLVGVESKGPGASPRSLLTTTLGDELRLATSDRARVVGISLKDRSAIMTAGKHPTAAFWINQRAWRAVTSSYYRDKLPDWVVDFNEKFALNKLVGREWRALGAFPGAAPLAVIREAAPTSEQSGVGPDGTPWANEAVLELARRAIQAYKLGQGPATDFLSVSLSANDYTGHSFGPDSELIHDITLRTDLMLADFLRFLDEQVGPGGFLVAFSSDHGVSPLPEVLREKQIEAGRIRWQDVNEAIETALRKAYGSAPDEKWVDWTDLPNVYLNHQLMEKHKLSAEEVARRAGEAALEVPGMLNFFTASQIEQIACCSRHDMVARRVVNSFFAGRSGDLMLVWKPFYHKALSSGRGTNHSSPWSYDTRVPLIFVGPGFRPGVYETPATPADLAPTLAAILNINPPAAATGRVLTEALATQPQKGRGVTQNRTNGPQR